MEYLISVDIGTTALKSSIISKDGIILASRSQDYPLLADGSIIEQEPHLWWEAFCTTSRQLIEEHGELSIAAIVLSGQMQDLILIEEGQCISNAILYSDTRSQAEFKRLEADLTSETLQQITRNSQDASGIPAKLLMLSERKMLTEATTFLLGAHDYLCWKLTGRSVTDPTNAATTGLMNYEKSRWDETLLDYLKIEEAQLPTIEAAGSITGKITEEAAEHCLLRAGLPVIHGAGDAASSTVGAGAGIPGVYSCYLGTSGWVSATVADPIDPSYGIFNLKHPNGEDTIAIGAMRTTGGNVSWLLEAFEIEGDKYEKLQEIAGKAAPGASGLFYLPYLQGERSPFSDPHARGAYVGIGRDTAQPEMFRAVLEGICYGLASIFEKIEEGTGETAQYVIASGGGAENHLMMQILSNIIGVPVHIAADAAHNGVSGSAIIAAKALSWVEGYGLPEEYLKIEKTIVPKKELYEFYQQRLTVFKGLYPALQDEFHQIANVI